MVVATGATTTSDDDGVDIGAADEVVEEAGAGVLDAAALLAALLGFVSLPLPVGVSPLRTQPVLSVRALGQVTCCQSTVGLSAPSKKSPKRNEQPACRAEGKVEQVSVLMPPYWAPQPLGGAPY